MTTSITHTGASINPAAGTGANFTGPVTYTVTAEDATQQEYTVTVNVASPSDKAITAFNITSPVNAMGTIDEAAHTVTLNVPYGTALNNMTTSITHTGASISPVAGPGANFTAPRTYTVTAEDGSPQAYTVTVTLAGSAGITITGPEDEDMTITAEVGGTSLDISTPLTISRSAGETLTITIGDTNNDSVGWYVDGVSKGSADSLSISAADYAAKKYTLLVLVVKDGIPYSRTINFTVTQ
jgi:hypothetical protein